MSKLDSRSIVVALVAFLACGKTEQPSGGASGGATAAGAAGSTGFSGATSSGGNEGAAGNTNTGGGLDECAPAAPLPYRRWQFTLGPGAAGVGGAGGAGDADSEGWGGGSGEASQGPCRRAARVFCKGAARVGGTESAPELTFADGSVLAYSSSEIAAPLFPDNRAWIEARDESIDDCPVCGSRDRYTLEIRAVQGGPVLFVELSGQIAQAPSADVLAQVFGAELRAIPTCQFDFDFDCQKVSRERLDFSVATTPEQLLRYGEVAKVRSSSGDLFDVLVSRSADQVTLVSDCLDGGSVRADSTFIASRVGL